MSARGYVELLRKVADLNAPDDAKKEFAELIRRTAALDGVGAIAREERVEFARQCLQRGEQRSLICQRLISRFDIGESTAYRDIEKALNTVPNPR